MTSEQILQYIVELKLQVTPKLDDDGNVSSWTAGKMIRRKHEVYVPNMDIARGNTIEDAITNLLSGKTIWNEEILPIHRHLVNMHNNT